jgi:RIP metalloprotease RseP
VSQPTVYASQDAISKFIADIRETTPGSSLQVTVLKEGSKKPTNIDLTPKPVKSDEASSPLSIGVMVAPNYQGKTLVKASSVGDAASKAAGEVYDLTSVTARTILGYVGSLVTGKGAPPGQSLSGPIGVIKSGSDVVSTKDIAAVVGFVAAISINLAVVNSLPLPALDGGQLVFVLAEAVTGKKIDQRAQESINAAALFLLLFVTFSTSVGDITSLAAGLR